MSVTGFLVDNTVQKYNYESLENYNTPDFSTSSTYQVGDYVMYQGKLYKCTTAIITGGAWDSTKWSLAILSDDVAELKSAIEVSSSSVNIGPFTQMGYIRDNGTIGSDSTTAVTGYYTFNVNGTIIFTVKDGYTGKVVEYSTSGVFSKILASNVTGSVAIEVSDSTQKKYRFSIGTVSSLASIPDDGLSWMVKSYTDVTMTESGKAADSKSVGNAIGRNLFDYRTGNLFLGYPNLSQKKVLENTNARSIWIPCDGNTVYTVTKTLTNNFMVAFTATEPAANTTVISGTTGDTGTTITVKAPTNANYLIVFFWLSPADTANIQTVLESIYIHKGASAGGLIIEPLSLFPEYIKNTLAYKPMAVPHKGYICLVSDDGAGELASYAIPMVISKNVPLTFAVMSTSEVFDNSTMQATVIDAVENHGCEISQHGGVNWTTYNEAYLNKFFDDQATFFASIGLTPKSAAIPSHYTSKLIQAIAGGRFGVVRSGYYGYDADGNMGGINNFYNYYTSGEGSNLYGLSSYNFGGATLAQNEAAIDYVSANNKVLIGYWHENSLDSAKKAVIEDSIDYAKSKGLTFVTLGQLANIIDLERTVVF